MDKHADGRDPLEVARAGRMFIDGRYPRQHARREAIVNTLGAELVGDRRLSSLVTCTVCGAMGNEGDDCGRRPYGHRLTTARLIATDRIEDESHG